MAPRTLNRLPRNAAHIIKASEKHTRHADGGGLYLSITPNGGRRWVFLYRWHGKPTEIGLGSARDVKLARARELATECRALLAEKRDPRTARRSGGETFGAFADRYIEEKVAPSLRNEKHLDQWKMTLKEYAAPLRKLPIGQIGTEDVLTVLRPIWKDKTETASRLRGRIEAILDAAKAKGMRDGENPARWRGHLDHILPARKKADRGHHAALPFVEIPAFMADLRGREGIAALAFEFTVLTVARSGETIGAMWSEFDLKRAVWTVPGGRMKAGVEHRVPLCPRAVEIVKTLAKAKRGDFVFPGRVAKEPMSNMAMAMQLRRMERDDLTVHGFRSTFRDWAGETTNFPREVCEAALAHTIKNDVEAAYRRGDALEKRRTLMDEWGRYCTSGSKR